MQIQEELPKGWQWVRCQDVIDVRDGTHATPKYIPQGIPLITSKNLKKGVIDFSDACCISNKDHEEIKRRSRVDRGDIIMAMIGTIGNPVIVQESREFSIKNIALFKFGNSQVLNEYFYYLLHSSSLANQLLTESLGVTQKFVSLQVLRDLKIPLPPLEEQKRIAAIARKCDRLRRTRRFTQQLSDTYLQSVFLEMFGDPATNPKGWDNGTIGNVLASSQYGTSQKSNSEKSGYPILGMGNLTYSGNLNLSSFAYVNLSKKEFKELKLIPGDVIFNRTNSTELVGKTAHWNLNLDAVAASYLVRLRLENSVNPDFFVALLNSNYFKLLFQKRCKKAVGQSNISPTLLKEFPMLIPPLPLQEQFAQIIQQFQRLRTQQREADRQSEHLFQTVLHRAFRGEL